MSYAPEIQEALDNHIPVVALESTLIAHGMPYPDNIHTALSLEQIIRSHDAIPATIAIVSGKIKIGLSLEEIERLAMGHDVMKASRRDLSYVISQKKHAGTTVATTMWCAHMAGIKVFATGGIGGVHRNAMETFDISADLHELARTPVAVVSSGAKSILDLASTLEYLETLGIPVVGVGTDEFPAFFSRSSGLPVPFRLDTPMDIARMVVTHFELALTSGVLIANPIPHAYSINERVIEAAIDKALEDAQDQDIQGKGITPFLLDRIKSFTEGKSLLANVELVKHNAMVAAQLARAVNVLTKNKRTRRK